MFITFSTLRQFFSVIRSSRPPNFLNLTLNSVRIGGFERKCQDKEKQNRVNLLCSTLVWPAQVVNIKHIHYKIQLFPSFCPLKGTQEQEKEQNSLLPACVFVLTIRFSWLREMFIGKKPAPVRIRRDPSLLIFRTEDETGFLTLKQANFPSVLSLCVISSLWFSRLEPRYINVCWCVCQWVSNSVCCVVSKSQQGAVRDHCSPVNHCGNSRRDAALTSAHTHTHR